MFATYVVGDGVRIWRDEMIDQAELDLNADEFPNKLTEEGTPCS